MSNIQNDENRFPLFNKVKQNHEISVYIEEQNKSLHAMGFTEHSFAHIGVVADRTAYILDALGVDDHTIDLALTAAWMHDLGNVINRVDHSQSGALMTFYLLDKMGIPAEDIAPIIRAIGNHDEGSGVPVSDIAAALILADKSAATNDAKTEITVCVNIDAKAKINIIPPLNQISPTFAFAIANIWSWLAKGTPNDVRVSGVTFSQPPIPFNITLKPREISLGLLW